MIITRKIFLIQETIEFQDKSWQRVETVDRIQWSCYTMLGLVELFECSKRNNQWQKNNQWQNKDLASRRWSNCEEPNIETEYQKLKK
jgi:hypothetical protein